LLRSSVMVECDIHFRLWLESTGQGPSFASVDVEKVKPRKLDEDGSEIC
jgi:hypothetical protein